MNTNFNITSIICILLISISINGCKSRGVSSSDQAQETLIKEKIRNRNYTFIAKSATPMGFRSISLTSLYTLKVSQDTIQSNLPYFGRAYAAPLNSTEGGINFTSTKFVYEEKTKKSSWDITIKPQENNGVRQLSLNISSSGYATLSVTQDTKQSISFYGVIE